MQGAEVVTVGASGRGVVMSILHKAEQALELLEKSNTPDELEAFRTEYLSANGILRRDCISPDCECRKATKTIYDAIAEQWANKAIAVMREKANVPKEGAGKEKE